jgi:(R,R)-butanediol dehydrogenase/meso-butanediol dehydrogenase/diacetyl reductase
MTVADQRSMRAIRWHGPLDVRVDETPIPSAVEPGEFLLRVLYCGICGTDLDLYRHGLPDADITPEPDSGPRPPLTLGHEICGEVIEIGAAVEGFVPGDVVAVDGNRSCGRCFWCSQREYNLCTRLSQYGHHADGGLAEFVVVDASTSKRVPPGMDAKTAALAEPLSCAVRAVRRSRIAIGATVTVFGGGPIGLLVTQVALASGATAVSVVEPTQTRRDLALLMGASAVLDPSPQVMTGLVQRGVGPDVVFECSGAAGVAEVAIRTVRRGGRVVLVGAVDEARIRMDFLREEKELVTSLSHDIVTDFAVGLDLLEAAKINIAPIVTEVVTIEEAHRRFFSSPDPALGTGKVLVQPR